MNYATIIYRSFELDQSEVGILANLKHLFEETALSSKCHIIKSVSVVFQSNSTEPWKANCTSPTTEHKKGDQLIFISLILGISPCLLHSLL